MRKHYVTFFSPGTLFAETTTKEIDTWDLKLAAKMASRIVERHGASPYAFSFETRLEVEPVPDGEGGMSKVEPKTVNRSKGMYYLGGLIETIDDVKARNKKDSEYTLIRNMECNDWPVVVTITNGFKSTQPFREEDVMVDCEGNITQYGDDLGLVAYRKVKIAEHRAEMDRLYPTTVAGK